MKIITVDAETFWSATHSLSKMSPLEYVMHPETELISLAIKDYTDPTQVYFGEEAIRAACARIDWSDVFVVGHNMSAFDAFILSWRLGIKPKMWGCTLAMARPVHAKTTGLSLAKLVEYYGIGRKDATALHNTRGKHLSQFTLAELDAMRVYNAEDTDQCFALFNRLLPHYSGRELWHIDTKIRALVEPKLTLDVPLLENALTAEKAAKEQQLSKLAGMLIMPCKEEALRAELASAPKFKALLESLNVEVPLKPSTTRTGVMIPALSKNDEGFLELLEHPDEIVSTAARVRLSVKSTLTETRLKAFIHAAQVTGGRWPVTTHYCGADTTGRASGWHYNPLNLPRVNPKKPKISDALRRSLRAQKGYKIVVSDSSGIEMRFNHFLWQVPYSTSLWKADSKADLYRAYMAKQLGCTPAEITDQQRHASKVENLALGFGMGPDKYRATARVQGGIELTPEQSFERVMAWRSMHPEITEGWKRCHSMLEYIEAGYEHPIDSWGIFTTCREGIRLPSGRVIRYPNLRHERNDEGRGEWFYGDGRHKARIYAGKIDENIVQAGARDVVYDVAFDVFKETGFRPVLEVYDELAYVVPDSVAEDFLATLQRHMRKPTPWFPALVKHSEGDFGDVYGDLK